MDKKVCINTSVTVKGVSKGSESVGHHNLNSKKYINSSSSHQDHHHHHNTHCPIHDHPYHSRLDIFMKGPIVCWTHWQLDGLYNDCLLEYMSISELKHRIHFHCMMRELQRHRGLAHNDSITQEDVVKIKNRWSVLRDRLCRLRNCHVRGFSSD